MDQPSGSTSISTAIVAATTTTSCVSSNGGSSIPLVGSSVGPTSLTVTPAAVVAASNVILPNISAQHQSIVTQQHHQHQQQLFDTKQEDPNLSIPSAISESQRSISAAPSASSSPILSPPGKLFGRNANGTMIATSRPSNEAEVQLYRVLQRASLLAYYDTLLEMGGDDVQQLYEAGEEEFLEIMALVGMASKPLHVRRLQKALHEWANNPSLFQGPMLAGATGFCETITSPLSLFNPEASTSSRGKLVTMSPNFNPTPLVSTVQTSSLNIPMALTAASSSSVVHQPSTQPTTATLVLTTPSSAAAVVASAHQVIQQHQSSSSATSHQVTSSSPQLTPVLTELQVARIALGAEKIAHQLPQREPRAQTSKKRTSRELEQVIAMSENDPRRMDEIRKYAAIYGRFDCKRRPEKPLTLHEVCVNEAAAQLCRLVPALLTRRDELFPLARQIVKDAGFGHSASIARYTGLVPSSHSHSSQSQRASVGVGECETTVDPLSVVVASAAKRQRLPSTETNSITDYTRDSLDDSRYNLFAMYQKFAKPPFDLSEIAKFSLVKSDFEDNDNDSRFSFSNSSSPPLVNNNSENERDFCDSAKMSDEAVTKSPIQHHHHSHSQPHQVVNNKQHQQQHHHHNRRHSLENVVSSSPLGGGVQVISASGGHIIAVTNPALALSPALNEALSIKREADSPEI